MVKCFNSLYLGYIVGERRICCEPLVSLKTERSFKQELVLLAAVILSIFLPLIFSVIIFTAYLIGLILQEMKGILKRLSHHSIFTFYLSAIVVLSLFSSKCDGDGFHLLRMSSVPFYYYQFPFNPWVFRLILQSVMSLCASISFCSFTFSL